MAYFRFVALDTNRKVLSSSDEGPTAHIEAPDRDSVLTKLHQMGLEPVLVEEVRKGAAGRFNLNLNLQFKWHASLNEMEMFCRVLAILLPSGITLMQALELAISQSQNQWFNKRLRLVVEDIRAGVEFSTAMAKHPRVFPALMVATVSAGEMSGDLPLCLEQLANIFKRNATLRREVISALTYPLFVLGFFLALIVAVIRVAPKVIVEFTGLPLTQMVGGKPVVEHFPKVIQICHWINEHPVVWLIPITILGFPAFLFGLGKRYRASRILLARLVHKIPLVGGIVHYFALVRMLEIFRLLQESGVETKQTFDVLMGTSGHAMIEDALDRVRDQVVSGHLSRPGALARESIFPPLMVELWRVGEQAGNLSIVLRQVGEYFYDLAKATTERIVALIDPIIIISMGAVITPVILAIYQSLFVVRKLFAQGLL